MSNIHKFGAKKRITVPLTEVRLPNNSDGYKVREVDDGSDTFLDLVLFILTNGSVMNPPNTRRQGDMKQDVVFGGCHRTAAYFEANRVIMEPEYLAEFEERWGLSLDPTTFVDPITEIEVQRWDVNPTEAHALAMLENFGINGMSKLEMSDAVAAFLARKPNTRKTRKELADALGVSEGTIANLKVLGDLIPPLRAAGDQGEIPASVLYAAARLPKGEQAAWVDYCKGEDPATKKIQTLQQRGRDLAEGAAPGGTGAKAAATAAAEAPKRRTYGQMQNMLDDLLEGDPKVLGKQMSCFEQTVRIAMLQEILGYQTMNIPNHKDGGVARRESDGNVAME